MVKQLVIIGTFLLIQNVLEKIYYIRTIFDFPMLAQYLTYNDKTLLYIEHTLYKLNKIKIVLENYCPIVTKLFQQTVNYSNFYVMIYFI